MTLSESVLTLSRPHFVQLAVVEPAAFDYIERVVISPHERLAISHRPGALLAIVRYRSTNIFRGHELELLFAQEDAARQWPNGVEVTLRHRAVGDLLAPTARLGRTLLAVTAVGVD